MPELRIKPCPFCGSKVTVDNINPKEADEEMYMFECTIMMIVPQLPVLVITAPIEQVQ